MTLAFVFPCPVLSFPAMRHSLTRTDLFSITLLLFLAAFVRFQHFGAIEHNIDRAYPIWQALRTLDSGVFPVTAQGTSVLFDNPALMGYLLLPATALTRTPVGAYIFVILLNWLAVAFIYSTVRRVGRSHNEAFFAAFLFTLNPWIIEYSRLTWVQGLLPFFICLLFWLIVPILCGNARRPRRDLFLTLVTLTALTQTYLLAFAILAPVGLLTLLFRRRILPLWKGWLPGLIVFMLATGGYAAGLLSNPQTTAQLRNFTGSGWHLSDEALQHAIRLVSGRDYAAARGMDAPINDSGLRQSLTNVTHLIIACLLVIGAVQMIFKRDAFSIITLIWFFLPILMMTYVSRVIHPFYLLLTLPAGHLLAAVGLQWLSNRSIFIPMRATVRLAVVGACCIFGVVSLLNAARYAEQTLARPGANGFTALPLQPGIAMVRMLLPNTPKSATESVFSAAGEWELSTFAGRLFGVDHTTDTRQVLISTSFRSVYLLSDALPEDSILRLPAWSDSAVASYTFADRWTVTRYDVEQKRPLQPFLIPAESAEGLALVGYQWKTPPTPGQTVTLWTEWHVTRLENARSEWLFAPFVHVFDSNGKRVAIGDGQVIPGTLWKGASVQFQQIHITIPPEAIPPFRTFVGQYDGTHGKNIIYTIKGCEPSPLLPLIDMRNEKVSCPP
jgi:hypothetical protein